LYGMERSVEDTVRYSARMSDWLVPPFHIAYGSLVNNGSTDPERWLFPGLVPLFIVLAATRARRPRGLLIVIAIAALTLAYFRLAERGDRTSPPRSGSSSASFFRWVHRIRFFDFCSTRSRRCAASARRRDGR
jgi:hypothetical protein